MVNSPMPLYILYFCAFFPFFSISLATGLLILLIFSKRTSILIYYFHYLLFPTSLIYAFMVIISFRVLYLVNFVVLFLAF